MSERDYDGEIAEGSPRRRARFVQEWLCLRGINVLIDGDYGVATAEAVREFQSSRGLNVSGRVNRPTFEALIEPLTDALSAIAPGSKHLGSLLVAYARQHHASSPREIGGQNMGPWVRLYMKGNEGAEWPWCAGFVCFVLERAADALGSAPPIRPSFSCDSLAASARERGRFLSGTKPKERARIKPGALFLSRRTAMDWSHTGIVIGLSRDTFETIEGNTNDAGDREGYEVCRRVRSYENKDFVLTNGRAESDPN